MPAECRPWLSRRGCLASLPQENPCCDGAGGAAVPLASQIISSKMRFMSFVRTESTKMVSGKPQDLLEGAQRDQQIVTCHGVEAFVA